MLDINAIRLCRKPQAKKLSYTKRGSETGLRTYPGRPNMVGVGVCIG